MFFYWLYCHKFSLLHTFVHLLFHYIFACDASIYFSGPLHDAVADAASKDTSAVIWLGLGPAKWIADDFMFSQTLLSIVFCCLLCFFVWWSAALLLLLVAVFIVWRRLFWLFAWLYWFGTPGFWLLYCLLEWWRHRPTLLQWAYFHHTVTKWFSCLFLPILLPLLLALMFKPMHNKLKLKWYT